MGNMNDKCFKVKVLKEGYINVYARDEDVAKMRVENNYREDSTNMQILWNKTITVDDVQELEEL